jgi:hypothetical protein
LGMINTIRRTVLLKGIIMLHLLLLGMFRHQEQ